MARIILICLPAGFVLRNPPVAVLLEVTQEFSKDRFDSSALIVASLVVWCAVGVVLVNVDSVYAHGRFAIAVALKSCYIHHPYRSIHFLCGHDVFAWFHYYVWYPSSHRPCQW